MSEAFTVLAFDFGMKKIGIAVGQTLTLSANPLTTIPAKMGIPSWPLIEKIIKKWGPSRLLVGIPYNMDGTEQPITRSAKKFANRLKGRFGLSVELVDERLSTREAYWTQSDRPSPHKKQNTIDSYAAVVILERWLDELGDN